MPEEDGLSENASALVGSASGAETRLDQIVLLLERLLDAVREAGRIE